jgi:hypothetical protein
MASMSCDRVHRAIGCSDGTIMSPRDTSISSARWTVTDIGGKASATGPAGVDAVIVDVKPLGSTTTSSPGLQDAPATVPA